MARGPLLLSPKSFVVFHAHAHAHAHSSTGMTLINRESFWTEEAEAPLLLSNLNFLGATPEHDTEAVLARTAKWLDLAGVNRDSQLPPAPAADAEVPRILQADADRTFATTPYRSELVRLLHHVYSEFQDYHQGLGYVASFLSLTLPTDDVLRLLLELNSNERFAPGYWMAAPPAYVRDSRVFQRLVAEFYPEVAQKLQSSGVVPEAYASKWFVGLCVHVLPFKALFAFFERYLRHGYPFLFQFALQLIATLSDRILDTPSTDVSTLFALLRLDPAVLPERNSNPDFFLDEIEKATQIELPMEKIAQWREEEMKVVLAKLAAVKAAQADEDSDDEIEFSDEEDDDDDDDE